MASVENELVAPKQPNDDANHTSEPMTSSTSNVDTTTTQTENQDDDNQMSPPTTTTTTTTTYTTTTTGGGPVGDPRNAMASQILTSDNQATKKLKRIIQICFNLIEIIFICVFLPLDWSKYCDRSGLRIFLIARASADFVLVLMHIATYSRKRSGCLSFLRVVIFLFEYTFVFYALAQIARADVCNSSTYVLSLVLCILSLSMIGIPILIAILICCCLPCVLRALVRMVELQNEPPHATQEQIDQLTRYKWTPTLFVEQNAPVSSECPICLIEYEDDVEVFILQCKHACHHECLETWLKLNSSCPVCRASPFDGGATPQQAVAVGDDAA